MADEPRPSAFVVTELAIVIVNYNSTDFLLKCLESIDRWSSDVDLRVVVVDNASASPERARLPEPTPARQVILNYENVGFSRACNQGIRACEAESYLLLNPDVELHPGTLRAALDFLKAKPDAGIVGCRVLNPDGSLQLASRRSIPTPSSSFYRLTGLSLLFPRSSRLAGYNLTYLDENQNQTVEAVSGSFLLFRHEVLSQVAGLDEDFFLYGEDLDFCLRVSQAGWKIYYFAGASVTHHKSQSADRDSSSATFHYWNAMRIFYLKHAGRTANPVSRALVLGAIGLLHRLTRLRQRLAGSSRVASRR